MRVAEAAGCLFVIAFAVHWLWWRIRIPRRQTATILLIFLGLLPLYLAALVWIRPLQALGPWSFWPCLHIAICQIAGALGYAVFYSVFEATSPTLRALLYVAAAGPDGRAREELMRMIRGATSMQIKLDAMVRDKMLAESGGSYHLTGKGVGWAKTFARGRRWLGLGKGG
jgi:hypothetical protein